MAAPIFGFLAFTSGSYEGAIIRDMRLANALHRRGFKVVIYWLMESNRKLVADGITQRVLLRGTRYLFNRPSHLLSALGRLFYIFPAKRRRRYLQQHPTFTQRLLTNFVRSMADGCDDPALARRLEKMMIADGVTHLLPTFAMSCPIALAVKKRGRHPFEYLATFQGEEIFANYANSVGRRDDYYHQLRQSVAASAWPAVCVSNDYGDRLHEEMQIDRDRLVTIYPGVEMPTPGVKPPIEALIAKLPGLRQDVPIVAYFGRQDSEKGIDLLLYAVRLLHEQNVPLQLICCGGTSFGLEYREVCEKIADHLRITVMWKRRVTDEVRAAIYSHARFVVYPSIHREPFGMVAVEAMSYGTPVLVPDHGGITEAIRWGGKAGGLTFKSWDTQDLASQMRRLLCDDDLHHQLSADARTVAEHFNVESMTDQVLNHMKLNQFGNQSDVAIATV